MFAKVRRVQMNKVVIGIISVFLIFCSNTSCAKTNSSDGIDAVLEIFENQQIESMSPSEVTNNLEQFKDKVAAYIKKVNIARQEYYGLMEPAQKLVARCNAIKSNSRGTHKTATRILEDTCITFKNNLKAKLYRIAKVLEDSKEAEKRMLEEVEYVKSTQAIRQLGESISEPIDALEGSIEDLININNELESELGMDSSAAENQ